MLLIETISVLFVGVVWGPWAAATYAGLLSLACGTLALFLHAFNREEAYRER